MKHTHQHGADVKIGLEFDKDDVVEVVDKITDSVVVIIAVATAAHICKKWLT